MTRRFDHELSGPLARQVRDADAVPEQAVAAAQARLEQRLQQAPRRRRRSRGWMAATATASLALVLVVGLPLMSGGNDAFAAVQAHLRDFRTLAMDITQRHDGEVISTSRTVMNDRGVLRTDVGDQLSIIVDPPRGRVLTLLHGTREAMVSSIPQHTRATDGVAWIEQLRDFQGQATLLPTTRLIDGRPARGWALDIDGQAIELWADADGLPLEMRLGALGNVQLDYRFTFDAAVLPGQLSSDPPAGYSQVPADGD